jgi:prepilin-type processing-associated H-X9-DG protein
LTNYSCQGNNFGTTAGNGVPANTSVGAFGRNTVSTTMAMIRDGTSNTFLAGETLPGHCTFMGVFAHNFPLSGTSIPINIMEKASGTNWYRTCGFKSLHTGGANFVMCDGSVHFISQFIDYKLYNNLGTINGGEVVSLPQ